MSQTKQDNYSYNLFLFIALVFCPIVVLAPLGSWTPLVISAVITLLCSKNTLKSPFIAEARILITAAFLWIITSTVFFGKNLDSLEKAFHFIFLILAGLIMSNIVLNKTQLQKVVIVFSISFILSTLIIIIETKVNLGLKLWLSKNFDFSNFNSFYELKSWINLTDFRKYHFYKIISYNDTAYIRGVTSLTLLSLPLFLLCLFYNKKLLAYVVLITSFLLAFSSSSFTIILCYGVALFFGIFFYFHNALLKKYLFWFLGIYFLICPFILGKLDYKNFSKYEWELEHKRNDLFIKYCEQRYNPDFILIREKYSFRLYCNGFKIKSDHNILFYNENNLEKIKVFLEYKFYVIASQKLHRLIIWSYVKEKILDKPLFGHGFFSSRYISKDTQQTNSYTKYQLIPLHPHNSILQIWLELGIFGVIIFFIFIQFLLNKIYVYSKINHKGATLAFITFFQVFTIGQISFGFWQSWWIAVILIVLILYKHVFRCFKSHVLQSDSSS